MGVGAALYMYDVMVKKFTFAISSPDEFLFVERMINVWNSLPPTAVVLTRWRQSNPTYRKTTVVAMATTPITVGRRNNNFSSHFQGGTNVPSILLNRPCAEAMRPVVKLH